MVRKNDTPEEILTSLEQLAQVLDVMTQLVDRLKHQADSLPEKVEDHSEYDSTVNESKKHQTNKKNLVIH